MSQLLLDTHVFIWFSEDAPNLPAAVREKIESADSVYLSIVSLWEIASELPVSHLAVESGLPASTATASERTEILPG